MTIIEVIDAEVRFGGVRAVDEVSLRFEEGRLYGLAGPNGSGKSTLLSVMSRMIAPTRGRVLFCGAEYQARPAHVASRLGIARTFQTVRLMSSATVMENVMVGADSRAFGHSFLSNWLRPRRTRLGERSSKRVADESMDVLGLGPLRDRFPGQLPYGVQRRVEIARALAGEPTVLLLDEPTAGMSREERDEIGAVLLRLRAMGLTQVLVEHDMPLVIEVCDELVVMNTGKVIATGVPRDVVRDRIVQEAYLGRNRFSGDA